MTSTALRRTGDFLTYLVLITFSLFIILPILWTLRISMLPEVEVYSLPPDFSTPLNLDNYRKLLFDMNFMVFLRNSLFISISTTLISVPIATLGGFAFARYRVGGRVLQFAVLGTQMLPGIILVLPIFVVFNKLHLTNSFFGLTLAYMSFNLPFLVWMLIGFFEGIPRELEEAAALDGLSPLKTFFKIIVPVATPGILAAAILSFIFCWNEFLFALILSGGETMTIPVRLAAMKTKQGILIAKLSVGVILAIFPMVIISPFVKKYLISGLTLGSVK